MRDLIEGFAVSWFAMRTIDRILASFILDVLR